MTAATISTPIPQFFDVTGAPLTGGRVYFGAVGGNPETAPITVYWDADLTQPAAQPVQTLGGYPARAGTPSQLYAPSDYSVTVKDRRGRQVLYSRDSAGITFALASTATGKGASLVGMESAGTVQSAFAGRTNIAQWPGCDTSGVTSSRQAFQNAIAYLTALGGGVLTGPKGDYLFDTSSDATALLVTAPILFDFPPGTRFFFSYWPVGLVNFVGVTGGGIRNVEFVFTGTRPGSASGGSVHFGFDGSGVLGGVDWAASVLILGSSNVVLDGVKWRGQTTANIKEIGVCVYGGTAAGTNVDGGSAKYPGANAVYSTGNKILNCRSDDVYFGIVSMLQTDFTVDNYTSDRYKLAAFVGPGHAIYQTGCCKKSRYTNCVDLATSIDAYGSGGVFNSAASYQFRSPQDCLFNNMQSSRREGFGGFFNSAIDNEITALHWSAERVGWDGSATPTVDSDPNVFSSGVIGLMPQDTTGECRRNYCADWYINDKINTFASRSGNIGIIGYGGTVGTTSNISENVMKDIHIIHYPDSAYGRQVWAIYGQNGICDVTVSNLGTATNRVNIGLVGSAAGLLTGNTMHVALLGSANTGYGLTVTNSGGGNTFYLHGNGAIVPNTSPGFVASDRYIVDPTIYGARADLISTQCTPNVIQSLTFAPTVPTPHAGLTYVGSALSFTFNATGVFAVTWPASFRKAADGAAAAGKSASTRFICTDAATPIWVQQGGALTYN